MLEQKTIVALSTPPGVGALGVIRLSGDKSIALVNALFVGKNLIEQESHTLHFGQLKDTNNNFIDEVVVSLFKAPKSYTGEDVVEISCHGSPYILQKVMELWIEAGATLAKPGEFTMRAFLNGKMDLSQAEAVAELIASSSESSHQMAMYQMRGGFSKRIKALRERLIKFASLIELELDFGEEDVEFADRNHLKTLVQEILKTIEELTASFQLGNVIKNGVNTVIAGRPNAGKSTLLNALLNEQRAIVSEIAGTTRDTIEATLNIKGITFRLIDTAGIREATDTIEAIGVQKTMEKINTSAIVIYVFDAAELNKEEVIQDLKKLNLQQSPTLLLANKTDLLSPKETNVLAVWGTENYGAHFQLVQAANQHNIGGVREQLYQMITKNKQAGQHTAVSNARHFEALQRAQTDLQKVSEAIDAQLSGDLIALDIRAALHALGEITGEVSTDDLLDSIFRDFCIGK